MDEKTAIKKGFNAGYWLEKYEPELSKMLQDSFRDPDHPYAKGLVKGSREFLQEQFSNISSEIQDNDLELGEQIDKQFKQMDQSKNDIDLEK